MENSAAFRFYHSLNDFLPPANQGNRISYYFNGSPAIKDAVEAIGIPHVELDVIVVNEKPVDFYYKLTNKDEVSIYPLEDTTFTTNSLTPAFVYPLRFIADVHAGKLAKALRMRGFDTVYEQKYNDRQIAEVAETDNRIVLTRDKGLLKQNKVKWGHWLRSQNPDEQLQKVIKKFNLTNNICPFVRCIVCNGTISTVKKEEIIQLLTPKTIEYFDEFYQCTNCKRVYWKGSHYHNMCEKMGNSINKD